MSGVPSIDTRKPLHALISKAMRSLTVWVEAMKGTVAKATVIKTMSPTIVHILRLCSYLA